MQEGAYPEHLAEGEYLYDADKVRECMNRCLDAFESGTPGSDGANGRTISNQAFYVKSDKRCACSSGPCSSQLGGIGAFLWKSYAILRKLQCRKTQMHVF